MTVYRADPRQASRAKIRQFNRSATIVSRIYEHLVREAYRRYQVPVMLYYGLIDGTPETLAEIAEIMGYPEEVIRNSIQCCLSPLFQKIHHERVRRTGLDKLFQD